MQNNFKEHEWIEERMQQNEQWTTNDAQMKIEMNDASNEWMNEQRIWMNNTNEWMNKNNCTVTEGMKQNSS